MQFATSKFYKELYNNLNNFAHEFSLETYKSCPGPAASFEGIAANFLR